MPSPVTPRTLAVITLVVGLLTTTSISQYFYRSGKTQWQHQAYADAERISELLVFWLQLAYEPVLGLSMLMQGSQDVTPQEFNDALQLTHQDDISVQRTVYAFVATTDTGSVVQLSTNEQPLFTRGTSLDKHESFQATAARSLARPGKVTAGPIFRDTDHHHKLFFAIPTGSQSTQGFMVALTDIETLLHDLHVQNVPRGLSCLLHTADIEPAAIAGNPQSNHVPVASAQRIDATIAGQQWWLEWQLHDDYQGGHPLKLSLVVMVAGSLISLLTALLAYLWLTHRARATQLDQAYQALQNASEKLIKSEKMASLGSLVAGIAHEMNTHIGNSLTVATALRDRGKQFSLAIQEGMLKKSLLNDFLDSLDEATELLENNTRRAAQLVGNFKQVAVDQSSERRRSFDLKQAVDETLWTLEPTMKHTRHTLQVDIPEGIQCDNYPGAIGQILTNLVSNSLQHGFEHQPAGHITIRARCEQGIVHLDYSDDGAGIPPEFIKKVFDPFFTTKLGKGGSGLGLHIIYNLVTGLLGGDIKITSETGQGVQVTTHFPAVAPARHEPQAANDKQ